MKKDAYLLRENTGTSGVIDTARKAVAILADHDIPHLIAGGVAVQEYGCPPVAAVVRDLYWETWDALRRES